MPLVIRCPHCNKTDAVGRQRGRQAVPLSRLPEAFHGRRRRPPPSARRGGRRPAALPRPPSPREPRRPGASHAAAAPTAAPASRRPPPRPTPTECPACKAPLLPGGHRLHGLRLPDPAGDRRRRAGGRRPTSAPTRPAASPTRPANATASAAARRCRPRPAPCCTAATASNGCWPWAASAPSTWPPTPRPATGPVAIKDMICADPQEFAIRLNFFRREAEILRSLESIPIVPRVYDLIEQGQTAHLVLEFIRGQDLLKIMEANNNKPFPLDQVIEWAKSICDVLTHMHTQSPPLVHRDLKPDNIMLLEDQQVDQDDRLRHGPRPGPHRRRRRWRPRRASTPKVTLRRSRSSASRSRAATVRPGRDDVSPGDRQGAGRVLHGPRAGNAAGRAQQPASRPTSAGSTS